ncbi:S-methyl-5'-thioadenosine phosphorylase [Candidatus Margulisiibacteriota bacterium]
MIGIIGGSGLDDPKILKSVEEKEVDTPYGKPSSKLCFGKIEGKEVVILSRHGKNHSVYPTAVNFRANIWALKEAGCKNIIATTAVGSLREDIKPGDLVFMTQFIDFTKLRKLTFFEDKVIHTPMPDPFNAGLREILIKVAKKLDLSFHERGTVVTIEGPRFSTRAESNMFRLWGADIINMSTVPEVCLANELGLQYQSIAMSTDYDCWKEDEAHVTFEMVMKTMKENAEKVKNLLISSIPLIS